MNHRIQSIVLGFLLTLPAATTSHAMSELGSISITPLWPTNSQPGNVLLYEVAVERLGQGLLEVDLSCAGLPPGATAGFAFDSLRYTGRAPRFMYFTMAITTDGPTATDSCRFTVTGVARRETVTSTNNLVAKPFPEGSRGPLLVGLDVGSSGGVQLRGFGNTAQTYQIEATGDLAAPNWTPIGTSTADGNGRFTFIQPGAAAHSSSMQFYRAVEFASPGL